MDFLDLLSDVFSKIDISSSLIVLGVTEAVRGILNILLRDKYTDYLRPFIALLLGQLIAFASDGRGLNPILHGLELGGGAIVFYTIWDKFKEGWSWGMNGKSDKVLAAKVEVTSTKAENQIAKMKTLLGKNKE